MQSGTKITTVNGASSVENSGAPAEMRVESETIDYTREPPPPYTPSATPNNISLPHQIIRQTVIIQQPLKHHPVIYTCGECGETFMTDVKYVNTRRTHLCAGFICGCALWCMLCCLGAIPYLMPSCKKAEHYCSNCKHFLGDHSKV